MTELQHHHNVVWRCTDHVVWCPTYRRPVLVGTRLTGLLGDIAADRAITIREREVMPDYVHLLLDVDPQFGIHRAVKWLSQTQVACFNEGPVVSRPAHGVSGPALAVAHGVDELVVREHGRRRPVVGHHAVH